MTRWYSQSMYPAPRTIPVAATAAQTQFTVQAPMRIMNWPMNPFRPGSPIEDIEMIMKTAA